VHRGGDSPTSEDRHHDDDPPRRVVTPALLARPEFVSACAARDFGAVFALVRKYEGVSQVRIAAALDMTASRVGEVIRGHRQITSIEVVERISDRLGIPGTLLGLAPRKWESRPDQRSKHRVAAGLDDLAVVLGYEDRDIGAESALRVAHTWLVTEPPQITELASGRQVGSGLVCRLEARIRHLRHLDDYIGGQDSDVIMTHEVAVTAALLRQSRSREPVALGLLGCLAELCQLAGWVLDDAGRHDEATRYYLAGVRAAQAARAPTLAANLLSTLSYQRANTGHPQDAVLLARSALQNVGPSRSPLVDALFWDRAAWAHARNGDLSDCERALAAADEAYERRGVEREPGWVYWLDRGELDVMAGRCLTELEQPDRAEPLLRSGIARYDATRCREVALYRSWLAVAYAKRGDVESACTETMRMPDAVEGVNSARIDNRVGALRQALRPYADTAIVREVQERFQSLSHSA